MTYTRLTIDGLAPEEVTTSFLTAVMDAADEEELDIDGVSIDWDGSTGGSDDGEE